MTCYNHTEPWHVTITHSRDTLQSHTAVTCYNHTQPWNVTITHSRDMLQSHTAMSCYNHTQPWHVTIIHSREMLQSHTAVTCYNHTQPWQCSVSDRCSYMRDYSDISLLKCCLRVHVYYFWLCPWAQQIFLKTFSSRKPAANFLLRFNLTLFHRTVSKCQPSASKRARHLLQYFAKHKGYHGILAISL